ncbi:hypothetical protein B0T24DRAFT_632999 [Lasiosphaeria ovina]|uniref:Uncharacterized protein n=1 Tax=Lasiosphaeria ovina TaxID=92902 RepID=A0AAE0K5E3_9PEZI|nr:hypothetical protein B0T24DRAFT_632999 [Lasiosphaeria ovina]
MPPTTPPPTSEPYHDPILRAVTHPSAVGIHKVERRQRTRHTRAVCRTRHRPRTVHIASTRTIHRLGRGGKTVRRAAGRSRRAAGRRASSNSVDERAAAAARDGDGRGERRRARLRPRRDHGGARQRVARAPRLARHRLLRERRRRHPLTAARQRSHLEVRACWRWAERAGCGSRDHDRRAAVVAGERWAGEGVW